MLFIWLSAWVPHAETMKVFCVYDLYWCPWQGEDLGGLCWDGFEGLEGDVCCPAQPLALAGGTACSSSSAQSRDLRSSPEKFTAKAAQAK